MSMLGIIGKKIGMTNIYSAEGKNIPCTIIEAGPCAVTQIKTVEKDGYQAIQIGFEDQKKEQRMTSALKGLFKKAGTQPKKKLAEFKYEGEHALGDQITVDIFSEAQYVDVSAKSKGKGFQGVVKRHGFSGVGQSTHGQHNRLRAPGSIGAGSDPSRVFKGTRMAGRMGGKTVKVQNLEVLKVDIEKNLLVVKGSVPGPRNSYVLIEK